MKLFKKMMLLLGAGLLLASVPASAGNSPEPVDYVNPLVGSLSKVSLSTGNTYPATAMPWGLNCWTPQTGENGNGWCYVYTADKIRGLKQTHQPSPWINDYGEFSIMPVTTGPVFNQNERASWFSHKAETSTPYYYSVYLADHDTFVELSPTERAAAFRITYPERDTSYLVVDAYDRGSYVRIIPSENKIVGYTTRNSGGVPDNFKNWFVLVSDTPMTFCATADGDILGDALECSAGHALALVGFKTSKGGQVNLKVASSFISLEQAELNLRELGDGDFDRIKAEGRAKWNDVLGRFRIIDDDLDHLRTFYSCLYRCLLFPRDFSEIDAEGNRVHYSPHTGEVLPGYFFTDTGFWDTFRALFPLLNLVYPEVAARVQEGLVNDWKESGFLPEWESPGHRGCMVGNNSASVVADAYLKGIRGYDAEALWDAVTSGAHSRHPRIMSTGRACWEEYDRLGYVPCDAVNESAARTLEYAYDDWCIWKFGEALGKSEEELSQYREHALNYRNLYNPRYGLMQGRKSDGTWNEPFNHCKWGGDFTEGNSLHYTWSVFHDPQGLIDLMGGDECFASRLDTVFSMPPVFDASYYRSVIHEIREMQIMNMGNYAHGNQPIQHMLYLYDWCGQPWKAQLRIRQVMDRFYTPAPDGYCGDEDNGQTSAWYVFSAMGFYPVCPGSNQYALGTPLFKKMTVLLPSGKKIRISAPENDRDNFYVKSLKLKGRSISRSYLTHEELVSGARLKFRMASGPELLRGSLPSDRPYSMTERELK
ncbi:MAG: GH92 family glycosyl hydrolase [Candidatus Cryptobacteroides sp.]